MNSLKNVEIVGVIWAAVLIFGLSGLENKKIVSKLEVLLKIDRKQLIVEKQRRKLAKDPHKKRM